MDESPAPLENKPADRGSIAAIWLPRIAIICLFVLAAMFAGREGLRLRHWTWDTTASIRYVTATGGESGIDHDYEWARKAAAEGTLNQYEKMQREKPADPDWLDDAPLKLEVLALWGKWSAVHFTKAAKWSDDHSYALAAPLLHLNLFMELVGLVSAFCLVRLWVIRCHDDSKTPVLRHSEEPDFSNAPSGSLSRLRRNETAKNLRQFFRGCIPATIAVLLLWFNPAIVLNAYGWPGFDMWIIPIFLLAALLASLNGWFTAGIIIGVGTMLNAELALAIPVFLIWMILLHGWPAWPVRIARLIAIGVVVLLAAADWMYARPDYLQAVSLLVAEAAVFVAAMLIWSLVWRPIQPLRFASGLVIAIALIASPWLLSFIPPEKLQATFGERSNLPIDASQIARTVDVPAIIWATGILVAAIGLPWVAWLTMELPTAQADKPIPRWRKILAAPWAWRSIAAFAAIALVTWPWLIQRNHSQWWIGVLAAAAMITAIQLIRPRGIPYAAAAALGTALLLCMSLFHGSSAWYDCGFHFATIHSPRLTVGYTDNLPGIMASDFAWPMMKLDTTAFTIPSYYFVVSPALATNVPVGQFLRWLFGGTLAISCLGVGMHACRRSPRMLIALTAGWLMLFCFAPQIPERFLLFAAGISCICAGASTGMTLLGVFLSLVTFVMTLHRMLASNPAMLRPFGKELARQFPNLFTASSGDKLLEGINGTYPDLGYAVILCTLVFLYFSIAPSKRNTAV
jgi:hypothetical protein